MFPRPSAPFKASLSGKSSKEDTSMQSSTTMDAPTSAETTHSLNLSSFRRVKVAHPTNSINSSLGPIAESDSLSASHSSPRPSPLFNTSSRVAKPFSPNLPALSSSSSFASTSAQPLARFNQSQNRSFQSQLSNANVDRSKPAQFPLTPDQSFSEDFESSLARPLEQSSSFFRDANSASETISSKPASFLFLPINEQINTNSNNADYLDREHDSQPDLFELSKTSESNLSIDFSSGRKRDRLSFERGDVGRLGTSDESTSKRVKVAEDFNQSNPASESVEDEQHFGSKEMNHHGDHASTSFHDTLDPFAYAHQDLCKELRERWTTCTMDEWREVGKELSGEFVELLSFVQGYMEQKALFYDKLHQRTSDHNQGVLDSRDVKLKGSRQLLLHQTDALIGGPK